jgi:hypothetical protein
MTSCCVSSSELAALVGADFGPTSWPPLIAHRGPSGNQSGGGEGTREAERLVAQGGVGPVVLVVVER